jgi:fructosamine-3-kinase
VSAFERLYRRLDEIFPVTLPSLIHGDLWSGNFMVNKQGCACLIDPAAYYGHPEADIAMSTLFGRFDDKFYDAYLDYNPLEKGWRERLDIFNLYPLMVHVNLFGSGYLPPVRSIVGRF